MLIESQAGTQLQIERRWMRLGRIVAIAAMLSIGSGTVARAGGLYFPVTGSPSEGVAGAGIGARGNDASTAFWNPAAMTKLDDHNLGAALAPGVGNIRFDADDDTPAGGGDGGQQAGFLPILSSAYVHKLSDRIRLGLGLTSISGASLNPSNSWAGRNQNTDITLFTLSASPTVGVRITDRFSVGAGVLLTYGRLDWDLKVAANLVPTEPQISIDDADDFAAAPIASVFYEPTDNLRLGVVYLGESDLKLSGDVDANTPSGGVNADFDLDLPLAQKVSVHVAWDVADHLTLLFTGRWEDWSTLDTTGVSIDGNSQTVALKMKDTWGGAIGAELHASDRWTFQTGISYDSSALNDSDRTAGLPIDRTIRLGVGMLHDYTENIRLGFAFNYMNLGKAKLEQATVSGEFEDNEIYIFALNANWSKLPWSGRAQF